ncbi:MAG: DUF2029 domain-containing protein [Ignavibacteria bacterium]|nr:MAG: DUF2029 domain-containing protein [Ignavibacteria bacterium]
MKTLRQIIPSANLRIALLLAVLTGSILIVYQGMNFPTMRLSDSAAYYTSSKILLRGDTRSRIYDDKWFLEKSRAFGIRETTGIFYVNPPLASAMYLPVASLDPFTAKVAWNLVSVASLLFLWLRSRDLIGAPSGPGYDLLLLILMTWSIPLLRNLQRGQVYVVMLLLVMTFYRGYTGNRPWLSATSLAILILLKYFGWLFLLLHALERRWKDLAKTVALTVAGLIVSMSVLGTQVYIHHIERLTEAFHTAEIASSHLPCVPALMGTLIGYQENSNPGPRSLPLASLLTLISLAGAVLFTFRQGNEIYSPERKYRFFALLVLSIMFTPLASDHHYVMLSIPLFVYVSSLEWEGVRFWRLPAIALLTYLLIGWFPSPASYPWELLRTYSPFLPLSGAIALWFALVSRAQVVGHGKSIQSNPY